MDNLKINIPELILSGKTILKNISFVLSSNSIVAVVGPNGGGKTSLLNSILRPPKIKNIKLEFGTVNLKNINPKSKSKLISFLGSSDFSQPAISMELFIKNAAYETKIEDEKIEVLLEKWNIVSLKQELVKNLSQGQFQRLLLLTALNQESNVFILDEPERHLDPDGIKILNNNLLEVKASGNSVLFVTHDLNLALSVADTIIGISKEGEQVFYAEKDLVKDRKFLDNLFEVEFQYFETNAGTSKVFI
jgi:iron complex transport system ATP-binding protein